MKLEATAIEKLVTKYHFKGERLRYGILLRFKGQQDLVMYKDFDSYEAYRVAFDFLSEAKKTGKTLQLA